MPLPRTVVIDTNILEQYGFNFASEPLQKFAAIAQANNFTVLLPDPIDREVRRHIKKKSAEAQAALKAARHDAPFIQKWAHWPAPGKLKTAKDDIATAYLADWDLYLKAFKVIKLGYDGLNVQGVMDWYDFQHPPFGPGQKEKEFPDAFALASILAYAKTTDNKVAVVSADGDFAKFCALNPELTHFPDLPAFTDAFIAEINTKVVGIKAAVASNPAEIIARVRESFPDLAFYPEEDPDGDVSDVEVKSVALSNVRVIAIEEKHCTIVFDAELRFSAYVSYDDPDSMAIDSSEDIRIPLHTRAGTITETTTVSATITLELDSEWKSIASAFDLEIEQDYVTVESRPPICEDDDPPDVDDLIANLDKMPEMPLPPGPPDQPAPPSTEEPHP
jgi:hypothetical protein